MLSTKIFLGLLASAVALAEPLHQPKARAATGPGNLQADGCVVLIGSIEKSCGLSPHSMEAEKAKGELPGWRVGLEKCVRDEKAPSALLEAARHDERRVNREAEPEAERDFRRWVADLRIHWRLDGKLGREKILLQQGLALEKAKLPPALRQTVRWLCDRLEKRVEPLSEKDAVMFANLPLFEPTLEAPLGNLCGHAPSRHQLYQHDARYPLWELVIAMALKDADPTKGAPPKEVQSLVDALSKRDEGLVRAGSLANMLGPLVDDVLQRQYGAGTDFASREAVRTLFATRLVLRLWPSATPILRVADGAVIGLATTLDAKQKTFVLLPYAPHELGDGSEQSRPPGDVPFVQINDATPEGFLFGSLVLHPLPSIMAIGDHVVLTVLPTKRGVVLRYDQGLLTNVQPRGIGYPAMNDVRAMREGSFQFTTPDNADEGIRTLLAKPGADKVTLESAKQKYHLSPDRFSPLVEDLRFIAEHWLTQDLVRKKRALTDVDPAVLSRRIGRNPVMTYLLSTETGRAEPWLVGAFVGADSHRRGFIFDVLKTRTLPPYLENDVLEEAVASLRGHGNPESARLLGEEPQKRFGEWIPPTLPETPSRSSRDILAVLWLPNPTDRMLDAAAAYLLSGGLEDSYLYGRKIDEKTRDRFTKVFWDMVKLRKKSNIRVAMPPAGVLFDMLERRKTAKESYAMMLEEHGQPYAADLMAQLINNDSNHADLHVLAALRRDWANLPETIREVAALRMGIQYSHYPKQQRVEIAELLETEALAAIDKGFSYDVLTPRAAARLIARKAKQEITTSGVDLVATLTKMGKPAPEAMDELRKWFKEASPAPVHLCYRAVKAVGSANDVKEFLDAEEKRQPGTVAVAVLRVAENGMDDLLAMRTLSERISRISRRDPEVESDVFYALAGSARSLRQRVAEMLLASKGNTWAADALVPLGADLEPLIRAAMENHNDPQAKRVATAAALKGFSQQRYSSSLGLPLLNSFVDDASWYEAFGQAVRR